MAETDAAVEKADAAAEEADAAGGRGGVVIFVPRPQRSHDNVNSSKLLGNNEMRARMSNGSSVV